MVCKNGDKQRRERALVRVNSYCIMGICVVNATYQSIKHCLFVYCPGPVFFVHSSINQVSVRGVKCGQNAAGMLQLEVVFLV